MTKFDKKSALYEKLWGIVAEIGQKLTFIVKMEGF